RAGRPDGLRPAYDARRRPARRDRAARRGLPGPVPLLPSGPAPAGGGVPGSARRRPAHQPAGRPPRGHRLGRRRTHRRRPRRRLTPPAGHSPPPAPPVPPGTPRLIVLGVAEHPSVTWMIVPLRMRSHPPASATTGRPLHDLGDRSDCGPPPAPAAAVAPGYTPSDRKSTRLNSSHV